LENIMNFHSFLKRLLPGFLLVFGALAISSSAQAYSDVINTIDDWDAGFTTSGSWSVYQPCNCYTGTLHRADPGDGSSAAHWTFTGLDPGYYRVYATWPQVSTLATDAPFTITRQGSTGSNVSDTVLVDETRSPVSGETGYSWQTIGKFAVYGSTLDVQLTNAANGIVVADAVRVERVGSLPSTQDDGDAGFTTTGSWSADVGAGYRGGLHRANSGDGSSTATWSFANLPSGRYQVAVSWPQAPTLATNAPFSITRQGSGDSPATDTVAVDETQAPGDFAADGANWKTIGTFGVYGSTLDVQLSNSANGTVVADGVRIKQILDQSDIYSLYTMNGSTLSADFSNFYFPGVYRLAMRWLPGRNKPHHVSFTTQSGATLFSADLDPDAPSDFIANGYAWKTLGNVTVSDPLFKPVVSLQYSSSPTQPPKDEAARIDRIDQLPTILDDSVNQVPSYFKFVDGNWIHDNSGLGYLGDYGRINPGNGDALALWDYLGLSPGLYRIAATWPSASTLAQNAPFSVDYLTPEGTPLTDTISVDQTITPNDFTANGVGWKTLGVFPVYHFSGFLVRVTDAADGIVIADAVRVERVSDFPDKPNLDLRLGAHPLANGDTASFGSTPPSVPISKTFTLRNSGSSDLQIGAISLPSGYTLTANVGQTTLPPGEGTTFTVRLDAEAIGTYNGTLSFSTNDPNAPLFQLSLNGTVSNALIINDTDPGFVASGIYWETYPRGFHDDLHLIHRSPGNSSGEWSFNNLPPGRYQVAVTWPFTSDQATDAPFTISRTGPHGLQETPIFVNEATTPNDFIDQGVGWKTLGEVTVYGSTLTVGVANSYLNSAQQRVLANGVVVADAIRIERVGDVSNDPMVDVWSSQRLNTGGSLDFGKTLIGIPVQKKFTVWNQGEATLQLGAISLPAGYSLTSNFTHTSLDPGQSATFTVQLDATEAGTYGGTHSFSTNNPNANPFQLTLNGTVTASRIVDDTDPTYFSTNAHTLGAWSTYENEGTGYLSSLHRADPGDGSSGAQWLFQKLPPGIYQVAVTWPQVSVLATDAPFKVRRTDSSGSLATDTFAVNEALTPNDFIDGGVGWKTLGTFNVYGTDIGVQLTNAADGIVVADAVRIERVGDLP
jgi:hypothetical protein